jgi:type IV pilus assembly protein PilN
MIRINLLEVEKERRVKTPSAAGNPTTILAILIFGLAVAGFISYYIYKNSQEATLQKDVEQKRERKKILEPYIKKVDELERRRNELAKKNRAIEELRSQRTIPVHILDEVSRSLPEYLWLNTLSIKGNTLTIDGETLQEQAIPTFMKSLDASEFIGTASLIETKQKTTSGSANTTTAFKISAPITNPFKPKTPEVDESSTSKKSKKK